MIYKADFIQKTHLSLSSKTVINFGENFEFTIVSKKEGFDSLFCVENIKGDFEITKITVTGTSGEFPAIFNKKDKTFSKSIFEKDLEKVIYSFYISANIQLKEVCAVNYQFEIPVARLRLLKLYHFFKDEIVLPDYDDLKFTYYVKKIKNHESEGCDIEVEIENPYDVEIEVVNYYVKMGKNNKKFQVVELPFSTTTTTTTTTQEPVSISNIPVMIWVLIAVVAITIVVAAYFCFLGSRRRRNQSSDDIELEYQNK